MKNEKGNTINNNDKSWSKSVKDSTTISNSNDVVRKKSIKNIVLYLSNTTKYFYDKKETR